MNEELNNAQKYYEANGIFLFIKAYNEVLFISSIIHRNILGL